MHQPLSRPKATSAFADLLHQKTRSEDKVLRIAKRFQISVRRSSLGLAVSLAALAVGLAPRTAGAQIFTGVGPTASAVAAKPVPSAPVEILRFLPNTFDGQRLTGETGELRWPVYLTAAQAAAPVRMRIGYRSAVSVLPEASKLEVKINGRLVGEDAIDAANGLRTAEFTVPAGLTQTGYNAIIVSVRQRHRVDCSVKATYELWTTLDPSETGLVLAGNTGAISTMADLPALLPRADGSLPIHVLLNGKLNPAHLERLIKATQQIALSGRFQQPAVDFETRDDDIYGLDVAVGTRASLVNNPRLIGSLGVSGPLARLVPGTTGRPFLVITGSTDAEVDAAIALLASVKSATGTRQGLDAAASEPGRRIVGGETVTLQDLGFVSATFDGRFFRQGFNLMLPADFLASDYGRGTFDLAGAYAAGLAAGAQVRFDVNGHSSGVIKMPYAKGDSFNHNQLFMPLSLLRPGLNHFDLFAEMPRSEDATCSATDDKRFVVLDTSKLSLPTLARVERQPDLAGLSAGGLPYTRGEARLVVPRPDRETMAAALSLTARAAVAAGAIISFSFSTKTASTSSGSTLVVSPAASLDRALIAGAGLDPAAVEAAWRPASKPSDAGVTPPRWWLLATDGPAACHATSHADSAMHRKSAASDDIVDALSSGASETSWRTRLAAMTTKVSAWVDGLRSFGHVDHDGVSRETTLLVAQSVDAGSPTSVTTIVTAADATSLRASVACLLDPRVWSRVHGRLSALDGSTGDVTATNATSPRYVSSGTASLSNSRLVLAGWFSLNPITFVGVALLLAIGLSGTTLWFVRGVGRRPE